MRRETAIPAAVRRRAPLISKRGWRLLRCLQEHPDAPRFTYAAGDRLLGEDLPQLDRLRLELRAGRAPRSPGPPPAPILERLSDLRDQVPLLRRALPPGTDLALDWDALATCSRADLALRPWEFVPDDEPLDRLVIYRTAGTTGHPVSVPHHPRAIGAYVPLVEFALERHSVQIDVEEERAACFLLSFQVRTYTYATALAAWGGAGFAKLNLRPAEWPADGSARRYLEEFAPPLVTGDPVAFAALRDLGSALRPRALVSTSVSMPPALRASLEAHFGAPLIDWYSLVETGPLAYSCPHGAGLHLLSPDVHLEALDDAGRQVAPGAWGELAMTGGRNPLAPLLRYRTGDRARLAYEPCGCGDPLPRIVDLEGRDPVLFLAADGTPVSTVDISRLLREFPLLIHRFVQRADRSCELTLRGSPGQQPPDWEAIAAALRGLLGALPLRVAEDPRLGDASGGKVRAYESELEVRP